MPRSRLVVPALLLLLTACKKETPADPATTPTSIVAIAGGSQNGTVGAAVGTTPTFEVRNASGVALEGVSITITVTAGGGQLTGKPTSSSAGATPIGNWTLGTTAGTQTVTVSKGGITPLVFTANAAPGAAAAVTISGGNNQTALAGAALGAAVQGSVVDGFGNPRAGETVNWNIAAGGGSLTGTTTTVANGAGIATAPAWTLGKNGGTQSLRASSGAFEAFATATIQSAYQLELRWVGTVPTGATLDAFTRAYDRVKATVVTALASVGVPGSFTNLSQCSVPGVSGAFTQTSIPGLIIYANVADIDGAGGVLGSAGPCLVRDGTQKFRPALGIMRFDAADMPTLVADGRINAVILHEMFHVLGIGTIWPDNALLTGGGTVDARYVGALARTACATTNGGEVTCAADVPVHSADGAGSAYAHWRESTFGNELLTPFIGVGGENPMSAMTIQSLADLGYGVNNNSQDAFLVAGGLWAGLVAEGASTEPGAPLLRLGAPILPVFSIDRNGNLVRLRGVR